MKPGQYRLKLLFGDQTSENRIDVEYDPRLNISTAATNEIYEALKEMDKDQQTIADAVKQLVESKAIAKELTSKLTKTDKERYTEDIKISKDIVKEIDRLIAFFLGKEDTRQGITRNPEVTVMQRYSTARRYV